MCLHRLSRKPRSTFRADALMCLHRLFRKPQSTFRADALARVISGPSRVDQALHHAGLIGGVATKGVGPVGKREAVADDRIDIDLALRDEFDRPGIDMAHAPR